MMHKDKTSPRLRTPEIAGQRFPLVGGFDKASDMILVEALTMSIYLSSAQLVSSGTLPLQFYGDKTCPPLLKKE